MGKFLCLGPLSLVSPLQNEFGTILSHFGDLLIQFGRGPKCNRLPNKTMTNVFLN